jgi:predicted RNA methylase
MAHRPDKSQSSSGNVPSAFVAMGPWLERISAAGFTPSRAQIPELIQLLESVDREVSHLVERSLIRAAHDSLTLIVGAWSQAKGRARGRLAKIIVRSTPSPPSSEIQAWIGARLADDDAAVRRQAIIAVGKCGLRDRVDDLVDLLKNDDPAQRRAIVEALGKVGGPQAEHVLRAVDEGLDDEAKRLRDRALVMVARDEARSAEPAALVGDDLVAGQVVRAYYRPGLASFGEEELARGMEIGLLPDSIRIREMKREHVDLVGLERWSDFLKLRLPLFGAMVAALPEGGEESSADVDAYPQKLARAIDGLSPMAALMTPPPWRFRLNWGEGHGHRRAQTWRVAAQVNALGSAWINDSRQAPWEVRVLAREIELRPKMHADSRFGYRVADVPAASHPTLAAALALVCDPREGQVVWDPFVGSAQELIECSMLAKNLTLLGTDLQPAAIAAARSNFAAAGLASAGLEVGDSTVVDLPALDLVVSNPPMGRRVHARADLVDLLHAVQGRAFRALRAGGKMVWLSPHPTATQERALALGFSVREHARIDLGGFWVALEVYTKRS